MDGRAGASGGGAVRLEDRGACENMRPPGRHPAQARRPRLPGGPYEDRVPAAYDTCDMAGIGKAGHPVRAGLTGIRPRALKYPQPFTYWHRAGMFPPGPGHAHRSRASQLGRGLVRDGHVRGSRGSQGQGAIGRRQGPPAPRSVQAQLEGRGARLRDHRLRLCRIDSHDLQLLGLDRHDRLGHPGADDGPSPRARTASPHLRS